MTKSYKWLIGVSLGLGLLAGNTQASWALDSDGDDPRDQKGDWRDNRDDRKVKYGSWEDDHEKSLSEPASKKRRGESTEDDD